MPAFWNILLPATGGCSIKSEIDNIIELDDLLNKRIEKALSDAIVRGYNKIRNKCFSRRIVRIATPCTG